jgi:hypothetical protein
MTSVGLSGPMKSVVASDDAWSFGSDRSSASTLATKLECRSGLTMNSAMPSCSSLTTVFFVAFGGSE